jgi:hypothetical protein
VVFLCYFSTEFKSTLAFQWNRVGAAGQSCTDLGIWEFSFLVGDLLGGGGWGGLGC